MNVYYIFQHFRHTWQYIPQYVYINVITPDVTRVLKETRCSMYTGRFIRRGKSTEYSLSGRGSVNRRQT